MILGYVMNSYPMVSTTFIGREIAALEGQGLTVRRYAIRHWDGTLVDPADLAEQAATRYLLTGAKAQLFAAVLAETVTNPVGVARAARLTWQLFRAARGGMFRHIAYLAEAMALCRAARTDDVTHLHAHFSTNSASVAMLAHAMGGPPFSFTVHGPDEFFQPYDLSLGLKIARARFVAAISHFCRSQLMLFSDPGDWDKITIVHCGIDPSRYDSGPRAWGGGHVLFVGRLDGVKGAPLLIEAFARCAAHHPKARLTIVGDGAERPALEARVAGLGLEGRVRFTGFQTQAQVAEHLAASDMLALPSFAEGLPVVLMEAAAARLPVIASRVAGVPELVADGETGFVVPPGDLDSLTGRLDQLLSDPERAQAMGAAGRAAVLAGFVGANEAAWLAAHVTEPRPGQLRPDPHVPGPAAP